MKYLCKKYFLIGAISFVFYHCHRFIKRPEHRILTSYVTWKFHLQPHQDAKIYFDKKIVKSKIILRDKTNALLRFKAPVYKDKLGFFLEIKKNGFQTFHRDVFLQGEHKKWLEEKQTFVLNSLGSLHKFHSYHKVGRQPKSVTFINDQEIVIPLLNDSGVDILNIVTGKKIRIVPPKRYSVHKGFVESLVLKEQNELWISQMSKNSLHIFNLKNFQYKTSIRLSSVWVKVMAYHQEKKLVYASNWLGQNISVVDPNLYKEIKTIQTGGVPRGITFKPNSDEMYVAQFGDKNDLDTKGKIIKIDLKSDEIKSKIGKEGAKRHIVYSNFTEKLYNSEMKRSNVEIYDTDKNIYLTSIPTHEKPNTIALDPSHHYLYVSCRGQNSPLGYLEKGNFFGYIDVIDLKKHKIIESIEGGNQPTGLDVSPDGKYIAFSDFLDHAIRVYERLDN